MCALLVGRPFGFPLKPRVTNKNIRKGGQVNRFATNQDPKQPHEDLSFDNLTLL